MLLFADGITAIGKPQSPSRAHPNKPVKPRFVCTFAPDERVEEAWILITHPMAWLAMFKWGCVSNSPSPKWYYFNIKRICLSY